MVPIARVGILLFAALAAIPSARSQQRLASDEERQRQIVAAIEQEEARQGPYSEDLIGPLSELALLYQDHGDHALAVATIRRVLQAVRANEGLHSLEQLPLLRRLIENEEALGRVETAWELEQDLLTLAKRHPGDLRTLPVLRETGDKRMALLRQYLAGEIPPQIVLGCYYGWPRRDLVNNTANTVEVTRGNCTAGTRDDAVRAVVADAQTNYAEAIAVILRNEVYDSVELRELELALLRSLELLRARGLAGQTNGSFDREPWRSWKLAMLRLTLWSLPTEATPPAARHDDPLVRDLELGDPARSPDVAYLEERSVQRLLAYEIAASAPLHVQAEALVRVADYGQAEGYELALRMLEEAGDQTTIDELFAPRVPVVIPAREPRRSTAATTTSTTLLANPLASNETTGSLGYIDVAFEITRDGKSRRVRVLDTTTNATDAAAKRLVQTIRNSRFRPRVTEGELADAAPVVLRYYVSE